MTTVIKQKNGVVIIVGDVVETVELNAFAPNGSGIETHVAITNSGQRIEFQTEGNEYVVDWFHREVEEFYEKELKEKVQREMDRAADEEKTKTIFKALML